MEYFKSDSWDILLHAFEILLWSLTIMYLIKDRIIRRRTESKDHLPGSIRGFRDEIYLQLVRQQAETAMERLSDTIKRERKALDELIVNTTIQRTGTTFSSGNRTWVPQHLPEDDVPDDDRHISVDETDPYREVAKLAELGVSEKEISDRVSISKDQISLITKLKKYSQTPHGE